MSDLPAQAGAGWVHVRPLRQPRAPGEPARGLRTRQPAGGSFLAPHRRPPLAGLKLVRPRPRLTARRCGRSSLTPPARRHKPAATRKRHNHSPNPQPGVRRAGHRVNSARPLDNWGPYGCRYAEPPWRIEPQTYALRGACSPAAHPLAATMPQAIAQIALAALGFCADPVHEPVHGGSHHTRLPLMFQQLEILFLS